MFQMHITVTWIKIFIYVFLQKGEDTECNGDCNIKDEIKRLKEENKSLKKEILGFDHVRLSIPWIFSFI